MHSERNRRGKIQIDMLYLTFVCNSLHDWRNSATDTRYYELSKELYRADHVQIRLPKLQRAWICDVIVVHIILTVEAEFFSRARSIAVWNRWLTFSSYALCVYFSPIAFCTCNASLYFGCIVSFFSMQDAVNATKPLCRLKVAWNNNSKNGSYIIVYLEEHTI